MTGSSRETPSGPQSGDAEFFLRALDDLDVEHSVGDMTDPDYEQLTNAYTARAARALRGDSESAAPHPEPRRGRKLGWIAGVLVFGILAGGLIAHAAGQRASGDTATGAINESSAMLLSRARGFLATNPVEAIKLYDQVLQRDPNNSEALTYRGWVRGQVGLRDCAQRDLLTRGLADVEQAITADPKFAEAHIFRANLLRGVGRNTTALLEYKLALLLDTSGNFTSLVQPQIDALTGVADTADPCASSNGSSASST